MLSGKQLLIAVFAFLVVFCIMIKTSAQPMHMGGGHEGADNIGNILAAGIILSLLQQQG